MLDTYIEDYFKKNTNSKSTALLFSGGTDSLTCLFSLLNLNIKPILYSFHLEGVIHDDIIISKKVAEHFKLTHKIIVIPNNLKNLENDVLYLTQKLKINRKTNVQCTHPFLHVIPKINEEIIVSGLCADDLYGTSKSMSIKYSKDKVGFDSARLKKMNDLYSSAYKPIKDLVELYGKTFLTPYRDKSVVDYLMEFSWEELNKPKQKQLSYDSYIEYFELLNVYRKNVNLQVGSKIREFHNILLESKLNKNNRKRVDEIYKDLYKEALIIES